MAPCPGGPTDRVEEGVGGQGAELETGAAKGLVVEVFHAVIQSANGANHWDCPVAKAVHLIEAAGFESGRHEKEVASRFDPVSQRVGEADVVLEFIRVAGRDVSEIKMSPRFAAPQQHYLNVKREDLVDGRSQDVDPFLGDEAGNDPEERNVGPFRQAEVTLQFLFADRLAGEIFN